MYDLVRRTRQCCRNCGQLGVAVGERVEAGQTVLILEAMKMEHPMRAVEDGVVREVCISEGDQVEPGTVLLVVDPVADEGAGPATT